MDKIQVYHEMKLLAHRAGPPGHASGEQNVSKGSFVRFVLPVVGSNRLGSALRGTFRSRRVPAGKKL